jgi:hypothetical protein
MSKWNLHFHTQNEGRRYPLGDFTSGRDDAGLELPSDLLVDGRLAFPAALGSWLVLSSYVVTERLVSLTLQVVSDLDVATGFAPLAVLHIPQPVVEGRAYVVQSDIGGVGGWLVFGSGVRNRHGTRGLFSTGRQAAFSPRVAIPLESPPVTSLGKLGMATELTGLVRLRAEAPLEIVGEDRMIDDVLRTVAVVRLVDNPTETSLFQRFAGPCGGRPESNTCGDPVPVELLNNVAPDCDGNITLEFSGCAVVASTDGHGVIVDCGIGLTETCVPQQRLPDADGILPGEYDDSCEDPYASENSEDYETPEPAPEVSETPSYPTPSLPYDVDFEDELASDFQVVSGLWSFGVTEDTSEDSEYSEEYANAFSYTTEGSYYTYSVRNISLLGLDDSTLGRRVVVELQLLPAIQSGLHNGGLLINYRNAVGSTRLTNFYLAEADYDRKRFHLSRWNGNALVPLVSAEAPALTLGSWYRLTVETAAVDLDTSQITAQLEGLTGTPLDITLGPLLTNQYHPDTGVFGLHTNRAATRFARLSLEVA